MRSRVIKTYCPVARTRIATQLTALRTDQRAHVKPRRIVQQFHLEPLPGKQTRVRATQDGHHYAAASACVRVTTAAPIDRRHRPRARLARPPPAVQETRGTRAVFLERVVPLESEAVGRVLAIRSPHGLAVPLPVELVNERAVVGERRRAAVMSRFVDARERVEIPVLDRKKGGVLDEVTRAHAIVTSGANSPRVAVWRELRAVRQHCLVSPRLCVHPRFAAVLNEQATGVPSPVQVLRHVVVGAVPAGVLHQRERDAGKDRVVGENPGHCFVLEESFLPVRLLLAECSLVFDLGAREARAVEVRARFSQNARGRDYFDVVTNG